VEEDAFLQKSLCALFFLQRQSRSGFIVSHSYRALLGRDDFPFAAEKTRFFGAVPFFSFSENKPGRLC